MPDQNEVKDGRLVRPTQLVPDKITDRRPTAAELDEILAGPPEGEPNVDMFWKRMGQNLRARWFRYWYHTDPVVGYLVHKLMDEGPEALGGDNGGLPTDDAGVHGIRNGARFRVRCQCGRRISLFMHGDAPVTWQRQRVLCPECQTVYEFERRVG